MKTKEQYRQLLEAKLEKRKLKDFAKTALLGGALIGGAAEPSQAANTPEPRNVNTAQEERRRKALLFGTSAASLALGSLALLRNNRRSSRRYNDGM